MPEPMSPEEPRQPITPALPEQLVPTHEIKQFPIKVDGKETHYPENYPHQFIADGAPLAIRQIMGGMRSDTGELGRAIDSYLRPSQEIFENTNNLPEWYQQNIGPVLERTNVALDDFRPADAHILGDDFRWALEDIYNFPFPKELQIAAARSMGQTEGTVPTLSVLIQKLQKDDPEQFAALVETLLKRGPDGFAMAAYLAAPEEEKTVKSEEDKQKLDLDNVVKRDETGRVHIDPQALRDFFGTAWEGLRKGFDSNAGDDSISYDASAKIANTKDYKETPPKE